MPLTYGCFPDSNSDPPALVFRAKDSVKAQSTVKESPKVQALRAGWMAKKAEIFAGKYQKPDSEDPDTVNHLNWYESPALLALIPARRRFAPAERLQPTGTPTEGLLL